METHELSPPPKALFHLEVGRALAELSTLPVAPALLAHAPRGDGHPVMTLPGFMANDDSMEGIRSLIRVRGYDMRPWRLGKNLGPKSVGEEGDFLRERVDRIYAETGRTISLIGWSLGGVLAREVAKEMPEKIRQVITLGSPFAGSAVTSTVRDQYVKATGEDLSPEEIDRRMSEISTAPEEVPSTAIFSKTDGVVHWRTCVERPSELTDNIEVRSSHCGLGVNPLVLYLIADRLALPDGQWTPFDRQKNVWRRINYPTSGHVYGYAA